SSPSRRAASSNRAAADSHGLISFSTDGVASKIISFPRLHCTRDVRCLSRVVEGEAPATWLLTEVPSAFQKVKTTAALSSLEKLLHRSDPPRLRLKLDNLFTGGVVQTL